MTKKRPFFATHAVQIQHLLPHGVFLSEIFTSSDTHFSFVAAEVVALAQKHNMQHIGVWRAAVHSH